MTPFDNSCTLVKLRNEVWGRSLVPKKWMLNYIRKNEALYLLNNLKHGETAPESYISTIKYRCSVHRKKVYQAKKDRSKIFGTGLTKEERYRKVVNTADTLSFVRVDQNEEPFVSYFGSTRGKVAFVFKDSNDDEYLFTRTEVEKLASAGLHIPRGVISSLRTKTDQPAKATKTLRDIFAN